MARSVDGTPIGGLSLYLSGASGQQGLTTGPDRSFSFAVPAGTYQLLANGGGGESPALLTNRQLSTPAGALDLTHGDVTENLQFPLGHLTVNVLAPDGSPVPGTGFGI